MNLNFSKKTFCIFALLMVFISLSTVNAMEINSTDDVDSTYNQLELENDNEKLSIINDENYLSSAETFNGTTFSELRNKINSLNNGDVLDLTNNVTQDGNSEITISKSITINGNGVTIDAKGNSRIFYINGGETVILNNITFTNGKSDDYGGAIGIYSPCKIENCTFTNNTAHDGGAIGIREKSTVTNCNFTDNSANKNRGGAIYADEELIVTDCNFVNNHAYYNDGGAIFFYRIGNVSNCNFTNNCANNGWGGAVCFLTYGAATNCNFVNNKATGENSWGGAVCFSFKGNATNCTFTNNTASKRGGAIDFRSGNVINCNFTNNHVTSGDGGALYFYDSSTVMNSDFTNNTASRQGGAINFYYEGTVVNCNFTNNIASRLDGGAVNFEERNGTVANSNFVNNHAVYEGGAINFDKSSGIVTNCYFANNYVFYGAGVHIHENGIVSNCSFVNNRALDGGAVDFDNNCTVINCNFINNTLLGSYGYGSAVNLGSNSTAINCNFTNNTAVRGHGGALYITNGGNVTNCNFVNNKATGEESRGGAVYIYDGGNVTNCNFTSNNASQRGGAIYIHMAGSVTNCNFNNNTASQRGGAIYITNINNLTNCNFTSNTASNGGGAAWITSGTVENCNFVDNQATGAEPYGGAINFDGENCTVKNCNFTGNKAPHNYEYGGGGAIYFRVKGTVLNSNFADNTATNRGGAIYFRVGGNVANSSFTNNAANQRGGAICVYDSNVTNCNFTKNNAIYGSAIETSEGNVTNCNFNNHDSAIHSNMYAIVANSNFTNNYAQYGGAAICFEFDGEVINCNFVNNTASSNGGAIYFGSDGNVTNCNFTNNNANGYGCNGGAIYFKDKCTVTDSNFVNNTASISGAAIYGEGTGELTNCNFVNNSGYGGAVTFGETGDITSCNFTNNTASYGGGAVGIKSGNVTNCNFIGNTAKVGSAIYYLSYRPITSIISNSYFLNNKADVDHDAPFILNMTENTIEIIFVGGNNYINAIHTNIDFNLSFNNVTYWGANGIANTDSTAPVRSNREAGQNITVKAMINGNRLNITKITDKDGKIVLNSNFDKDYLIVIRHYSDLYYTEAKKIITNNKYHVNVTSQTTHNKTVNITAKSNIIQDIVEGTLFFILPDGTKIKANNVSNDTWWVVHTFEDYAEYNISAEYIGLDNVTVRNATVNITKADSTITLDDISMDYGSFTKITVETEGATGITADINGTQSIIMNNNTILIFDLDIGNYTLTVTTIPDEDHNSVNKTVNLTVNKLNSTLTVDDVVLDYGESKNVTVKTEGATGVTAKINGSDVNVIDNYTIPVSGLGAGNYTLTVTTIPDKYYNPVTVAATITVNKAPTIITVIDELMNLYVKDTVSDFANLTPEDAGSLNYVSSNEDVAKILDGKIIAVGAGKAKITVSFEGNDNYSAAENKSFYVIVKPLESRISVNKTEYELIVGDDADIIANATPKGLVIDYATDDTDIISVDENGHITALSNGTAIIFVSVGDNRIYDYAYVDVIVTVKKTTEINVNVSSDENNVTITATVDSTATGLIKFNISGEVIYVDVNNGKAVYNTNLSANDYNVEAVYLGDNNFKSNIASESFTVVGHVKQNTTIVPNVAVNNDTATITVNVNENATGFVTVALSGQTFIVPVESGKAVFSNDFKPGPYTADITYLGDNDFNTNSTTATFTITEQKVELKNTTIDVDVKSVENNVTITASVDSSASGLVEFNIGGKAVYVAVNNGKAVYNTILPAGDYNIGVVYLGDSKFNANRTSKAFIVADHIKQNTTIVPDVIVDNDNVTITVNVNENATGFIKFTMDGIELFAEVKEGKAIVNAIVPVGNYTIIASYLGDDDFNANSTEITFSVVEKPLKDTPIDVNVVIDDNNITITVNVDVNATGFVKFDVSGAEDYTLYAEVIDGKAVLEDVLAVGNYTVVVTYLGDDEFNSNSTEDSFVIVGHIKKDTSISAVPKVDDYTVTINVEVDANATGSVTIAILGQTFIVPVESGKSVFSYDFKPGTYTANVTYLGDNDFNANSTTATFTVIEKHVDLMNTTIDADVKAVENDVTITASVDSSASGLVEFNINGQAVYVAVDNGKAVYNTDLPAGDYNVEVVYLGDSKFNANRTSKAFTVVDHVKQNTTMDSDVVVDNNEVAITVDVNENATGFVKFNINGNDLFAEVKDGKAVLNTILPVGNYTIAATYLGDDDFNTNTTEITFSVVEKPLKDTPVDVDIQITENNITITVGVDLNATGLVKFEVSGAENYTLYGEVIGGKAILEDVLKPGDYTVNATYMGDENYNMNSTSETFTIVGHVKKDTSILAVPKVDNSTVTITVSVDVNATGSVTIEILGQTFIVPVENGNAVFSYDFTPGTYSANIVYLGDDNFNNATTTATFTVIQKAAELKNTTIDVDVKTAENDVTITASVDSSASGLVEFNIGGKAVYIAVANGNAVYNTDLPAGDYNVEVTYLGSDKFNANKTSAPFTVVDHIKQNTTLDCDVAVDNGNVTITVDVNVDATGFVKFDINGNDLFAEVKDGKSVLNTILPVGNYTIAATYLGDDDFNANSTEITFSVVEKPLKDTPIDVNVVIDDNNVTITVDVDVNAAGLVKFDVSGAENYTLYAEVIDGKAILEDVLTVGNYTIITTYLGDDKFNSNSTDESFVIIGHVKKDTSISAVPKVDDYTATINVEVDANATGSVTIAILGQTFIVSVESGNAVFSYDFKPGTYTANVTYLGDNDFNANSTTATFTVIEKHVDLMNTTIDVDVNAVENDVTITASVESSASGLVEFNINGKAVYVAVDNGKAVYNTDLSAGDYNVEVVYLGDSKFNANRTSKAFTVVDHVKQNTTMDSDVVVDNNDVAITVDVNVDATGFVKFNINGNDLFAEVKDGKAVLNTILPVGNYTITATYLGDEEFNANSTEITFSVVEKPLKDTPIDVNVVIDDNNVTITVDVDVNATGLVKFDVSGAENYTLYIDVVDGKAILEDVLTVGDYTVYATYMGDEDYNMNSTSETFTIVGHVKKDTAISAIPNVDDTTVSISIDVDKDATGYVAIGILGQTFIVPVESGKAVFSYDFTPGTYSANIVYLGDDNFNNATTTATFTVIQKASELKNTTINVDVKSVENDVTITATVDTSASGLVEFNIDGKAVYIAVNNGKAVYDVVLSAGDYDVEVTYLGSDKFNANKTSTSFSVVDHIKQNTTIYSDVVVDNNDVIITVDVDEDATGFVKFDIGGNDIFADVNDGKAVLNVTLPVGNYTIAVTYLGDDEFNENATTVSFAVDAPESASVNITIPSDIKAGDNATVKVEIPGATGNVTVIVDGKESVVPLVNGSAEISIEDISEGEHSVVVIYSGDDKHAPAYEASSFTVPAAPVKIATEFTDIVVTDNVVSLVLKDAYGIAIADENVSYTINGVTKTVVTDIDGSIEIVGEAGTLITVDYAGSSNYLPSNITIKFNNADPDVRQSTVILGNNYTQYAIEYDAGERGQNFTVQLKDANGNVLANKTVLIGYNGKTLYRTTDENGYARVQINLRDKNRLTFAVTFLGDEDYNATMSVYLITINQKPVTISASAKNYKVSAKTKKYTVTLKTIKGASANGKTYFAAGKKVTMKINGKTYTAKTNAKGQATFSLKITKRGKFSAVIKYAGDTTYKSASKNVKITIK